GVQLGERAGAMQHQQRVRYFDIKLPAHTAMNLAQHAVERHRTAVRPPLAHGDIGVRHTDDARAVWDVLTGQVVGIAAAVPPLVVVADVWDDPVQLVQWAEDTRAERWM